MMKVTVKKVFADKFTHSMYKVGDVIDVTDDRAKDMIGRGLCTAVESVKEEVKTAPKGGKKGTKNVRKGKTCASDND